MNQSDEQPVQEKRERERKAYDGCNGTKTLGGLRCSVRREGLRVDALHPEFRLLLVEAEHVALPEHAQNPLSFRGRLLGPVCNPGKRLAGGGRLAVRAVSAAVVPTGAALSPQ